MSIETQDVDETAAEPVHEPSKPDEDQHETPATFVLTLVSLASFAIYYFASWKALAGLWQVS
jgi:hypothetical protein